VLLPPPRQTAFREAHRTPRWHAWLRSETGPRRARLEDSWAVAAGVPMAGTAWDAFAVFDGLGGRANGQEAAWAAAAALPRVLPQVQEPADLLHALDPHVRTAGGSATAAVFLADRLGPEAWVLGAGDCSLYRLSGGAGTDGGADRVASLLPHDRNGRHLVTDCLGIGFRGGKAVRVLGVARGEALLLCTDGVEEAGAGALARCLETAPQDAFEALDTLLEEARGAGSTDDATALLLRRA
jgi:serine/threonine protein phosphatase PrpC